MTIEYLNHYTIPHKYLEHQGNLIKIQANYECRRHDTPAKPRVQ